LSAPRAPNILILITDQQRAPMHWPDEPGWLRELMPADAELARTGLSFTRAFCNTCMCTPSRGTLFTGCMPAEHGMTLTLTAEGAKPRLGALPEVLLGSRRALAESGAPRPRAMRAFGRLARSAVRQPRSSPEPQLDPATPNIARMLEARGYHVAYKGKWHLTKPQSGEWSAADAELIARRYGFNAWEPPDAGEDTQATHFGGGNAGSSGEGWDEDYTRQAERFLGQERLPEPFALVVSLVNPHDVLGYPGSYREGGYKREEFADLRVGLPATHSEDLSNKPSVHALMRQGQLAFLGPLHGERERLDYVNFYAYLHRLVDAKIERIVKALGDPGDLGSLRARTVVVRLADHGELGLAHGGLRQKMFNAYEETIRVPLVISNPLLFPRARETDALASLIDVMPTLATLAGAEPDGARGADLTPVLAHAAEPDVEALKRAEVSLEAVAAHPSPELGVQDSVLFTYDDHKAGSALDDVAAPPNRIRCIRERDRKYAVYFDPQGRAAPEFELYDLGDDPDEVRNLVDRNSGAASAPTWAAEAERLHITLSEQAERTAGLRDLPPR
jgi:arylsulfatase A-like enzyme